jgi:hypothetical protein
MSKEIPLTKGKFAIVDLHRKKEIAQVSNNETVNID